MSNIENHEKPDFIARHPVISGLGAFAAAAFVFAAVSARAWVPELERHFSHNYTLSESDIENIRAQASPEKRFEIDLIRGGWGNELDTGFYDTREWHNGREIFVPNDRLGGEEADENFGQTCLADTPYDTRNEYESYSSDFPQAAIGSDPENPEIITVVPGLPGLPVLEFEGLTEGDESLQPADPQTSRQLEIYDCNV